MDRELIEYYERELEYLYGAARAVGERYPKRASRLGLDRATPLDSDPFVKQIVEGVAFLTSRIHLRLDASKVEFGRRILEMIYPGLLSQIPSFLITEFNPLYTSFSPAPSLAPVVIDRGSNLSVSSAGQPECRYVTGQDVELLPLYFRGSQLSVANEYRNLWYQDKQFRASHVLRLNFETPENIEAASLDIDSLPIFLKGSTGSDASVLAAQQILLTQCVSLRLLSGDKDVTGPQEPELQQMGFDEDEALLPTGNNLFSGDRLFREYFAFRERFQFIRLANLKDSLISCKGNEFSLLIFLELTDADSAEESFRDIDYKLFCAPAINLFERHLIPLTAEATRHEHHLLTDRINPDHHEIHSVLSVEGRSDGNSIEYAPSYSAGDAAGATGFYSLKRKTTTLSNKKITAEQEAYEASEMFLSLVDRNDQYLAVTNESTIDVITLCTNRAVPLRLDTSNLSIELEEGSGYLNTVNKLAGPSRPIPALPNSPDTWTLVGLLSRNYRTLGPGPSAVDDSTSYLKEILTLLAKRNAGSGEGGAGREKTQKNMIETGIISLSCEHKLHTLKVSGINTVARGLLVSVVLDEQSFPAKSVYLFGAILERFFARQASINSLVETVVTNTEGREIYRWNPRTGHVQII